MMKSSVEESCLRNKNLIWVHPSKAEWDLIFYLHVQFFVTLIFLLYTALILYLQVT